MSVVSKKWRANVQRVSDVESKEERHVGKVTRRVDVKTEAQERIRETGRFNAWIRGQSRTWRS